MSNKTMLGDASGRGAVDGFRVTCPAMQHPYTEAEIDAVVKVMREACGQTQGKYMVEFEQAFCAFTGAKHAFAVNNCTSALKMAAIFCHIQPGDEVIIPAYTFCASAIPLRRSGCKDRLGRHQPGYLDHRPGRYRPQDHAQNEGCGLRAPARYAVRDEKDRPHRKSARSEGRGGLRAGARLPH